MWISYHARGAYVTMLFAQKLSGVYFQQLVSSGLKVPHVGYISYHTCDMLVIVEFSLKLPGECFSKKKNSPFVNVTAVFVSAVRSTVRILPCYLHRSYWGYVFNNLSSQVKYFLSGQEVPRCLYVSYHVCSVYIIMLFTHKLLVIVE